MSNAPDDGCDGLREELRQTRARLAAAEAEKAALVARLESHERERATQRAALAQGLARLESEARRVIDGIVQRVEKASSMSEGAVLETGNRIHQSVEQARQHLERSGALADEVGSESAIARAIETQTRTIREFVAAVGEELAAQRAAAEAALEVAAQVGRAGKQIREIAQATYILNLNAQVEAARLGERGQAFAVITEEMTRLSEATREANETVEELAVRLSDEIPALARGADQLIERNRTFGSRLAESLAEVAHAEEALRSTVSESLEHGRGSLDRMIEHSHAALSALQFQDPMVQALRQIPRLGAELVEVAPRTLKEAMTLDEADLQLFAPDPSLPVGNPLGDEEEGPEAGEVLLF